MSFTTYDTLNQQFKYDTVFKPIYQKHKSLVNVYLKWKDKYYTTTDTNKKSLVNKSYKYASAKLEEFEDVFVSVINCPAYQLWVKKHEWKEQEEVTTNENTETVL